MSLQARTGRRPSPGATSPVRQRSARILSSAALLACVPVAVAAALAPLAVAIGVFMGAVLWAVIAKPQLATYLYLGIAPLVVGVGRGSIVPGVRPNELLLVLLGVGVALGPVLRWLLGPRPWPRLHPVDWTMLALATTSSITPVLWMVARGDTPTRDDALYALALWKIVALYAMVRVTIRTDAQARTAAVVALTAGSISAVIGIAQAIGVESVVQALNVVMPGENRAQLTLNRASSTISTPIGFADCMMLCGALAVGWVVHQRRWRFVAAWAAALFAVATLASGQVSAMLGLVAMVAIIGFMLRRLGLVLLLGVPGVLLAGIALQPVLTARIEQLDPSTGLPRSWTGEYGRLSNLSTHVIPRVMEHANWLLGVQPSSRVRAPEPWREFVYIESGYVWLLWNGGLPLLVAFAAFVVALWRAGNRVLTSLPPGGWGVHAMAAIGGLSTMVVLMALDPHLTMRGNADLLFPIAAITVSADELVRRGPRKVGWANGHNHPA